jgi:peptide/nickel transport system substrate-binding protein
MTFTRSLTAALVFTAFSGLAGAQTVRVGNQGDALSMDPHSLNESLQLSVTGNVYEPLVSRGKNLELIPALATSWKQVSVVRSPQTMCCSALPVGRAMVRT